VRRKTGLRVHCIREKGGDDKGTAIWQNAASGAVKDIEKKSAERIDKDRLAHPLKRGKEKKCLGVGSINGRKITEIEEGGESISGMKKENLGNSREGEGKTVPLKYVSKVKPAFFELTIT